MKELKESTLLEVETMISNGMELIPISELLQIIDNLGYYVKSSFTYSNTSNTIKYNAKSLQICETDSKRSFAHVESRRDDNFRSLQKLRFNTFSFDKGRVIEL